VHNKPKNEHVCPRSGRPLNGPKQHHWLRWLFPLTGIVALIWFLIRVIPKPSRATYPCQRMAAPLAAGFVAWLLGLAGSTWAYRRARFQFLRARYGLAALLLAVAVLAIWLPLSLTNQEGAQAAFVPIDPPNQPLGVGKGLFPGRVVWLHEPDATQWDGETGRWWDEEHCDQDIVDYMTSRAIRHLAGETTDAEAWDALFRHFNESRDLDAQGYIEGESIVIKLNMNQDNGGSWSKSAGTPSPQAVYALVDQLINAAGVAGRDITLYDASRFIGDPIFNKIRANPDPDFQACRFVVAPRSTASLKGRESARHDPAHPIHFADQNVPGNARAYLPQCVTQAKYLINMALLRAHSLFGVTLCAKNHFGSVYFPGNGNWTPAPLHNFGNRDRAMGSYNCLVDLIGHEQLGGKTLLYLIDGLCGAKNQGGEVMRYNSFGKDWTSSLFASQDPIAIDSVTLDILRHEALATDVRGSGVDNYMHEGALAHDPPSGRMYDPEADGIPMESLGVHEHWNNAIDKQYSRNLGVGEGIELVIPTWADPNGPVQNLNTEIRYDCIRHAVTDATVGDVIVVEPGVYPETVDFAGKDLTVRSIDPHNLDVVRNTVIQSGICSVTFSGGETGASQLSGFSITGGGMGIYCEEASPLIDFCRIIGNAGPGIKLWNRSAPVVHNCLIAGNGAAGIEMWASREGRRVPYNYLSLTNCTVVENREHGIFGGIPTVRNSIIYTNAVGLDLPQIDAYEADVSFCAVEHGFVGAGNIEDGPRLVADGLWHELDTDKPRWTKGDYHLQTDSPCIDAGYGDLTLDPHQADMDGEPRIMGVMVDMGIDEFGL
jgi:hypothetical protein